MKISEIKDKELRELAELRRDEVGETSVYLGCAFYWGATIEGGSFWRGVYDGRITSLQTLQTPKQWLDERGTFEVGSTMYNLVLTILEDYAKHTSN